MDPKRVPTFDDLVPGVRIYVPYDPFYGLSDIQWTSNERCEIGTIVSPNPSFNTSQSRIALVMMDKRDLGNSRALENSANARKHAIGSFIAGLRTTDKVFFTVLNPRYVRIYDPTFLENQTKFGRFTCKCGFANTDVSVSSIINGKYVCYQCRVIEPRHRAT